MSTTLMRIFVCWDPHEKRMHLIANPDALEWLQGPAAAVVREIETEMMGGRAMDDPGKGERRPPAGLVTPTLVAAMLRAKITAAFPDETVEITRGSRVGGVTLDYGVLS